MPASTPNPIPRIPWITRRPLLTRSRQIFITLSRHGLGWLLARMEEGGSAPPQQGVLSIFKHSSRRQAKEFVSALVELGPTFIKMGQALSSRGDLLPPEYIEELSRLQDTIPPTPFEQIRQVLIEELGNEPENLYAALDPQPVASASIGQVYNAELKNGQKVVIKIIRPNAREVFERDLEIMTDIALWASQHTALGQLYDLPSLVEEFAYTVRNEFDYVREGQRRHLPQEFLWRSPCLHPACVLGTNHPPRDNNGARRWHQDQRPGRVRQRAHQPPPHRGELDALCPAPGV